MHAMVSSLKIVNDPFPKIVHYTYYFRRDIQDCIKFSNFVINDSMDCVVLCLPCLDSNASLFKNTTSCLWLTPSCTISETVSTKFSTTALLASIAPLPGPTTVSFINSISLSESESE